LRKLSHTTRMSMKILSLLLLLPSSLCFAAKTPCERFLSLAETKNPSLQRRIEAIEIAFEDQRFLISDHPFLIKATYIFEDAFEDWLRGFRSALKKDPQSKRTQSYTYFFNELNRLQEIFEKVAPDERKELGSVGLKDIRALFDRSTPAVKSAVLAFILSAKPFDAKDFIRDWARTFESRADRETMGLLFRRTIVQEPAILTAVEKHIDTLSESFNAQIVRQTELLKPFEKLHWRAVRNVLQGNDPQLVSSVLSGLRLPHDAPLGLQFNYDMINKHRDQIKNAPDDYLDLLMHWLPALQDHDSVRALVGEIMLLPNWNTEVERALTAKLATFPDPVLIMLRYRKDLLKDPQALRDLKAALVRRGNSMDPIIDALIAKYSASL
jgi:hypothetical protein